MKKPKTDINNIKILWMKEIKEKPEQKKKGTQMKISQFFKVIREKKSKSMKIWSQINIRYQAPSSRCMGWRPANLES